MACMTISSAIICLKYNMHFYHTGIPVIINLTGITSKEHTFNTEAIFFDTGVASLVDEASKMLTLSKNLIYPITSHSSVLTNILTLMSLKMAVVTAAEGIKHAHNN